VDLLPKGDRLLVRVLKPKEEVSKGGILLPDSAEKDRPVFGKVLAAGPGKMEFRAGAWYRSEMPAVNTIVMFGKHAGQRFRINDEILMCLREGELAFDVENFPYADEVAEHATQAAAVEAAVRPT